MKLFFTFLLFILTSAKTHAQRLDEHYLEQILANKDRDQIAENKEYFIAICYKSDSVKVRQFYNFLDKNSNDDDLYIAARSLAWKSTIAFEHSYKQEGKVFNDLQIAINKALESGDKYLMLECYEFMEYYCIRTGKLETALFYNLKTAELLNTMKVPYSEQQKADLYKKIGDLYFKMEEYTQAINYTKQSINTTKNTKLASAYNTVGLCYQRLKKYDDALVWYNKSLNVANNTHDSVWAGIIQGNIGAMYFEQKQDSKALPLLWQDFRTTLQKEPNSAANALQRIALLYLRNNKKDSSLVLARQSLRIIKSSKVPNYYFLRNSLKTAIAVFKANGMIDSAYFYSEQYHVLNDSLNNVVIRNRADVVQTNLNFEKTQDQINYITKQRQAEKELRYILLILIGLLVLFTWFYSKWQRQKNHLQQKLLLQQKQIAEQEIAIAKDKLEEFTQNILQKNELIDTLNGQLKNQNVEINEALITQKILTENDWLRFKSMFENVHPGFISKLQLQAPDITNAEIRFAVLTKLNFGKKHIASMLGISDDAVRKTKNRLRQRLNIATEIALEELIGSLIY